MTTNDVIENKISAIQKYLKILEGYKKYSREEIEKDLNIRGAVERYLYLAVQSVIELAETIISFKKLRKPSVLRESFEILNEEGLISDELNKKMVNMVGFRNIISHDYEDLDYNIVYDVLHNKLKDIEEFTGIFK